MRKVHALNAPPDQPAPPPSPLPQSEAELKRLKGEALLLLDLAPDDSTVQPKSYYLVAAGSGVRLVAGEAAAADPAAVIGPVLFLCRPPSRESAAAQTSELLSL